MDETKSVAKNANSWHVVRVLLIALLVALLVILSSYLIWRLRTVMMILLLSALLAYALRPLVEAVESLGTERWKLPHSLCVVFSFIFVGLLIWLLVISLLPPLAKEIVELKENYPSYRESFIEVWQSALDFYHTKLPVSIRAAIGESFPQLQQKVTDWTSGLISISYRGLIFIIELLLVPILAFYFLNDTGALRKQTIFFFPKRNRAILSRSFDGLSQIMYRYVLGQLILCLVAFAVVSIALWALKIDFWLLLGVLAGITRAIPVIGPLISGVPIVAAVLAQSKSVSFGLWVTLGFALLHFIESKYLMPAILGRKLDIHPVLIIISLLIGAEFMGIIGMFIAVPVFAAVKFFIADYRNHTSATLEETVLTEVE